MKKAFDNLEKGQINLGYGLRYSILGFFHLLIVEPSIGYWKLIKEYPLKRRERKQYRSFWLSIFPLFIILAFVLYGFIGLYTDIRFFLNRDVYISKLQESYKDDIERFFREYEIRYTARDCKFMRIVASDERMFDLWGRESYGDDYNCGSFKTIQERIIKPIHIGELKESGNKVRVSVDVIWIDKTEGIPLIIKPLRIELRRTLSMDIRHLNIYGDSDVRHIQSKLEQ